MSVDFTFDQSELNEALKGASTFFDKALDVDERGRGHAYAMLFQIAESRQPGSGRDTLDKLAGVFKAFERMAKLDPVFREAFGDTTAFKDLKFDWALDLNSFLKSQSVFNESHDTLPTPATEFTSNKYGVTGVDILRGMNTEKMEVSYEVFSATTHLPLSSDERRQHSVSMQRTISDKYPSRYEHTIFDPNRGVIVGRSEEEAGEFLDASLRRLNESTISDSSKDAFYPRYLRDVADVPPEVWNGLESVVRHVQNFMDGGEIAADGRTETVTADTTLTPRYTFRFADNVLHFTVDVTLHRSGQPDETRSYTDDAAFANWKQFDWQVKNDFHLPEPDDLRRAAFDPAIGASGKLEQLVQSLSVSSTPDAGVASITPSVAMQPPSVSLAVVR